MAYSTPARPRRGLRLLVAALVGVLLLLLVLDRGGEYVAERVTASTLRESQHLKQDPDVEIGGFPFLTQFASGDYDEVEIHATDVPVGNDTVSVTLDRVDVTLDDLTVARDFSSVHADRARAVGALGYGRLGEALGISVRYAGDGRIRASKSITILGQTFTPTITAAPVVVDGVLGFGKAQINGLGELAGQAGSVLSQVFGVKLPLDGIPFDVRVQKLSADSDGLRVDLVGSDLTYRGS